MNYRVVDNFLPEQLAELAWKHFPSEDSGVWKTPSNKHTKQKSVMNGVKVEQFGEARPVFEHLNSATVLLQLSKQFGINGLVPDPYYAEGGFHRMGRGGYLDVHADFTHHDLMGLERRINCVLYLNKNWKPEYKGNLCLYDQDLKQIAEIEPAFNRAVLFECSSVSYHGHPEPLNCPEGEYRKSIAIYYYTLPRPESVRKPCIFPADPLFRHAA